MKIKVEQFMSNKGYPVKNQFVIYTDEGAYFQSYDVIIAFNPFKGKIQLDENYWNYSRTTQKYRNMFLREYTEDTRKNIENGVYILKDLN